MSGVEIARVKDIPWEDRVNVDGWPSRAGMYRNDEEHQLCMRLIDYPVGSTEPRHVHAGAHATTVLRGRAIVDGLTLQPLDVVLGPSNEPHGPLQYPEGCQLFSVFHGSYYHSEVEQLSDRKQYRLIRAQHEPWKPFAPDIEKKTLVDRGVGRLLLEAVRATAPAAIEQARWLAALVVEGRVTVGSEALGAWDFLYAPKDAEPAALRLDRNTTLLTVTLR